MTDTETKFWAFLSYSPQDNRALRSDSPVADRRCWGNWLNDALKTFAVPAEFAGQVNGRGEIIPERIAPIFRDETELAEGGTLSAEIRQALEQSVCLLVVCSPRSAQSQQVNEVVRYFKQLGRDGQILPIVIAGEPNASEGDQPNGSAECFVPALRHPVLPDGTLDTTRRAGKFIFVDARHGAEKREILATDHRYAEADLEMAKVQLIALLLGVGFNGLWWREQKRHFFDLAVAQQQAREAQTQAEEARRQLQIAQQQSLENQKLPREIEGQIQDAQNQVREAQSQTHEAKRQLQELQNKFQDTQAQLEDARQRVLAAESKALEAQNQAQEMRNQFEASRQQARVAENKVLELQNLPPADPSPSQESQNPQSQLEAARQQAQAGEEKFLAAQRQVQEFQNQARAAKEQVQDIQNLTRDIQNQIKAAEAEVQKIQNQSRNARRLTKIFALLAVLALLAAGEALRQRRVTNQALATASAEAAGKFEQATGGVESVRLVLQKIGGAEQAENRRRSLDELVSGIPIEQISEALAASAVIVNDSQRSYFQLAVLDKWMKTNLPEAIHWVCQLPDSETKSKALEACIDELAKTDVPAALVLTESLPDGVGRAAVLARLWLQAEPFAAWEWINRMDLPPAIIQLRKTSWPWTKFLLNADSETSTIVPEESEMSLNPTNGSAQTPSPQ
jgi:hypothetical protein